MLETIVVNLRVESDFHLWLYKLFEIPNLDDDFDSLLEIEDNSVDLATLKAKFCSSEIFSPGYPKGYSWVIVEAGIPYESKIGHFLIQAYVECLAQQILINEEINSEGLPVVHKLDNWRVIHLITGDNQKLISNFGNALIASNRPAISQLRGISLEKIAGMTYEVLTGEMTQLTGDLEESDLNSLVQNYAETISIDSN